MNYEQEFKTLSKNINDSKLNALFNLLNNMLEFFFQTSDDIFIQECIEKCIKQKTKFSKEKRRILLKYLDYIQEQIYQKNLKDIDEYEYDNYEYQNYEYENEYDGYEDECFEFMY